MVSKFPGVRSTSKKRKSDGATIKYYYHRATGMRLYGDPGSDEFLACYAAAEDSMKIGSDRSDFSKLIKQYISSTHFTRVLRESTQVEYKRMLLKAEEEFGTLKLHLLDRPNFRVKFMEWRDEVGSEAGPREADNRAAIVSAMLSWAVDRGLINSNSLRGFKRFYSSPRSEVVWTQEQLQAMMDAAPEVIQRALMLAVHTVQRQGDILRLKWSAYDGEYIRLRQSKSAQNGRLAPLVAIKCSPGLKQMLDAIEDKDKGSTILTTATGKPLKKRYFARLWKEAAQRAGVDTTMLPGHDHPVPLHCHDIRGTMVTLLSRSNANTQQIAAVTGHRLTSADRILDQYLARPVELADQAMDLLASSPLAEFANRLQTRKPSSDNDR